MSTSTMRRPQAFQPFTSLDEANAALAEVHRWTETWAAEAEAHPQDSPLPLTLIAGGVADILKRAITPRDPDLGEPAPRTMVSPALKAALRADLTANLVAEYGETAADWTEMRSVRRIVESLSAVIASGTHLPHDNEA